MNRKSNSKHTRSLARPVGASVSSLEALQEAAVTRRTQSQASGLDLRPVFEDPRKHTERRKRSSVFFTNSEDRRHSNRRNACMIDTEWWISRRYSESQDHDSV